MSPPFFDFTRLPTDQESWDLHALSAEQLHAPPLPGVSPSSPPPLPREFQHYEDIPDFVVMRLGGKIHDHFAPLHWEKWTMNHIFQVLRGRAPQSMPFYGVVHSHDWVRFYREMTATATTATTRTADTNPKPTIKPRVHTLHRYGDEQLIAEFVDAVRQRHRHLRGRGALVLRAYDGVPPPRVRKVPFHVDQIEWVRGQEGENGADGEEDKVRQWHLRESLLGTSIDYMSEWLSGSIDGGVCTTTTTTTTTTTPARSNPFSYKDDDYSRILGRSAEPPVVTRESFR